MYVQKTFLTQHNFKPIFPMHMRHHIEVRVINFKYKSNFLYLVLIHFFLIFFFNDVISLSQSRSE